ncbi:response regulator [Aquabacterium sp. A08]|uniref:response regulator n=1 Tax=Aquabacterium sp. A08 TaxID=2718532 RepID=UPI00142473C0|nr:response regulator [Aquabacterium sp. A08]NIC43627.1 response regulator [Aquabacterium sp. A08]
MTAPGSEPTATPASAWRLLSQVSHDLRGPLTVILGTAQLLQPRQAADADAVASILGAARKMQEMLERLTSQAQQFLGEATPLPDPATGVAYTTGIVAELEAVLGQTVQVCPADPGPDGRGWPVVLRLDLDGLLAAVRQLAGTAWQTHGLAVAPTLAWTGSALRLQWPMPGGSPAVSALEVPATAASERSLRPQDLARSAPSFQEPLGAAGHALWLAEDHADVRELLVRVLGDWGLRVQAWADGQALIDHLEAHPEAAPALVLTDLTMPGATGHDVLQACRRACPTVPVVLLSGTQPSALGSFAPTEGAWFDAALTKPIDWRRLRHTLQTLLPWPANDTRGSAMSAEWEALRQALALGAVTDVLELAQRQAQRPGQDNGFWAAVVVLAQTGDLDAVEDRLRGHQNPAA